MSFNPRQPGRPGAPSIATPYLRALHRMHEREASHPNHLCSRASALLEERFGPSEVPVHAQFVRACIGLMSEHTHYFDGFALMMALPLGTAVALRTTNAAPARLVFEGDGSIYSLVQARPADGEDTRAAGPSWQCVLEDLLASNVEAAVASTLPNEQSGAYLAALGVACKSAEQAVCTPEHVRPELAGPIGTAIEQCLGRPFSIAYAIAAASSDDDAFILVDTDTRERLMLEGPPPDEMGWGLVYVDTGDTENASRHCERKEQAGEVLARLQQRGFHDLVSLRELQHRDLHRALEALPASQRPLIHYLVGENRRVQKLVAAIRRKDWQMFGALLLMSYAAQRNDLGATGPALDAAVAQVEQMSIEGMYGATVCGGGGCVLVVGQPFVVPACLDRIQAELDTRFGITPITVLL